MAYVGRYIDRNPCFKSAGIPTIPNFTAGDALHIYNLEDAAQHILQKRCNIATEKMRQLHFPPSSFIPKDTVHELLSTELQKSHFAAFRETFAENLYFKKAQLGQPTPSLSIPEGLTNESTTFGRQMVKSEPLYELILPKRSVNEINQEYFDWHDKYILSHSHYFPSEQINRRYDPKYFSKDKTFGIIMPADWTGTRVKNCLVHCDPLVVIGDRQKQFLQKRMGRLGKKPLLNLAGIETDDRIYGKMTTRDECDVKALIENISPCLNKADLIAAIAHINRLRLRLFEHGFHVYDLKSALMRADTSEPKSGFLPLKTVIALARTKNVRMDEEKMRTLLRHLNLIVDDDCETELIDYEKFLQIIQIQYPMQMTGNTSMMPLEIHNKETIYRDFCKDLVKSPNEIIISAKEAHRQAEPKTTVKDVISPNIMMRAGLEPNDFAEPRTKEVLGRIFQNILAENFETIWERAKNKFQPFDDLISVQQIREIVAGIELNLLKKL